MAIASGSRMTLQLVSGYTVILEGSGSNLSMIRLPYSKCLFLLINRSESQLLLIMRQILNSRVMDDILYKLPQIDVIYSSTMYGCDILLICGLL